MCCPPTTTVLISLSRSVFEWELRHQDYLDYLNRLNAAMLLAAVALLGVASWMIDTAGALSDVFVGGDLLLAEVG